MHFQVMPGCRSVERQRGCILIPSEGPRGSDSSIEDLSMAVETSLGCRPKKRINSLCTIVSFLLYLLLICTDSSSVHVS
ncbi:hypothetical protein TNCV_5041291 [Trichonephila clavipes]|nr:hypothetical protein TNCV_5041291 [Trichonephila clavipes]